MSYEFHMVDMGGIDIATVNGTVVDGLYNKLLEGMDACGNLILYNWKFAEIEIVPSACSVLIEDEAIIVNGAIRVSSEDVVSLILVDPPPVPIEPITITENGVYTAQEPLSGYNPVTVNVESGAKLESSLAVVDGEYVYSGLSSPGTPYIVDGNFGATASSRLVFKSAIGADIAVEFDFKIWIANSPGWTFSFGGSNTDSGGFIILRTDFVFYANGTRFSVAFPSSLSSGEHNMKIVVYPAYAELYDGDQLIATGNSTYCINVINYLLSEGEIWLLANRSAGREISDSQLNNIKIKLKLEGE